MALNHYKNQHVINDHLTNYYTMDNREFLISWLDAYHDDNGQRWFWWWSMLLVNFGSDFYSIYKLNQIHFHFPGDASLHDCNVTLWCHRTTFAREWRSVVLLLAWKILLLAENGQNDIRLENAIRTIFFFFVCIDNLFYSNFKSKL